MKIHAEAKKLFFRRKPKHRPGTRPSTSVGKPNIRERIGLWLFKKALNGISHGHLSISLPDGTKLEFRGRGQKPSGRMTVNNWNVFWRFTTDGEIGLGEAYVDNDWDSDDMTGLLDCYIANLNAIEKKPGPMLFFANLYRRITFKKFRNSLKRAKKNISAHYDLGNDLFNSFLDSNLMYSCAIFRSPKDTLEKAQLNKIEALIQKTGIKNNDRVLEIGTGWGGFALEAVRKTGCHVTTITLSDEQYAYVKDKVRKSGLSKKIKVLLCDYRDMEGRFDKIISIEMLEAVGFEYYGVFFRQCEKLLAPGGKIGLQVITVPDHRFDEYRRNVDWIQTYIFPGGFLPSLHVLNEAMKNNSTFHVEHIENIGLHYATTLGIWRKRFLKNLRKLQRMDYDGTFQRIWLYYLHICGAAFKNRILNDLQIILTREGLFP
jgi:cyclopropane-fatty-acyl-phospholipid synthase